MSAMQTEPPKPELLNWTSSFTGVDVAARKPGADCAPAAQSSTTKVPRPMPPGTKVVHGKVPGPKNHLLTEPEGFVADIDAKLIIANSLAEYMARPATPTPATGPKAPTVAPNSAQKPDPSEGDATSPGGSGRSAVAAAAKAMMGRGTIHARALGGPQNLRQGWEDLVEIFQLAAPAFLNQAGWLEKVLKPSKEVGTTMGIPHWCGIFALYATKTGGVSVGTWKPGSGIAAVGGFRVIKAGEVGIGDVVVKKANVHHAVVIGIDGDKVTVINGNSGGDSSITQSSGKLSDYDGGYYSAFSK